MNILTAGIALTALLGTTTPMAAGADTLKSPKSYTETVEHAPIVVKDQLFSLIHGEKVGYFHIAAIKNGKESVVNVNGNLNIDGIYYPSGKFIKVDRDELKDIPNSVLPKKLPKNIIIYQKNPTQSLTTIGKPQLIKLTLSNVQLFVTGNHIRAEANMTKAAQ